MGRGRVHLQAAATPARRAAPEAPSRAAASICGSRSHGRCPRASGRLPAPRTRAGGTSFGFLHTVARLPVREFTGCARCAGMRGARATAARNRRRGGRWSRSLPQTIAVGAHWGASTTRSPPYAAERLGVSCADPRGARWGNARTAERREARRRDAVAWPEWVPETHNLNTAMTDNGRGVFNRRWFRTTKESCRCLVIAALAKM